jgi:tRNA(Ile)-lysidine synthase
MAAPKSSPRADFPPDGGIPAALADFLASRLHPGARLCVALSGGRDSTVLLHALAALRPLTTPFLLSALHVHHGLSSRADAWAGHCAGLCSALGVPLRVVRVTVPRDSGEGLEAAARRLRHAAFADCEADWLALAHHRDDQAETVLLNLLRGAGVDGAAGMPAERAPARGPRLLRPLLAVPGEALAAYAVTHGLAWIEDESNRDTHFRRNFLRHDILPALQARFPGAPAALARAAGHFAETAQLLDALAALDRAALAPAGGRLPLDGLCRLPPARARNLLRSELAAAGLRPPPARWLDEALRQLGGAAGALTCIETGDGALHVYRGELHVVPRTTAAPAGAWVWHGQSLLPWGSGRVRFLRVVGAGLDAALCPPLEADGEPFALPEGSPETAWLLRGREGGERLQPDLRRPRRTLGKLLQAAGIPPWMRAALPCLWRGERLLWVGGIGVDAAAACPPGAPGVQPVWEDAAGRCTTASANPAMPASWVNSSAGIGRPNR